jgi:hypothetical protein
MEQVVLRSIKEIIYNRLRTRRSYENDKGFTVHVQEVQGDWLIRPTIFCFDETTGKPTTITAERAQIFKDPDQDQLILEMVNSKGETSQSNATRFNIPGSERFNMSLNRAAQKGGDAMRPSQFAMKQIPAEVDKQSNANDRIKESMAIQVSMGLGMGRYNLLSEASLQSMLIQIDENKKRLIRLELEPYRRWSFGFASFSCGSASHLPSSTNQPIMLGPSACALSQSCLCTSHSLALLSIEPKTGLGLQAPFGSAMRSCLS